MASSTSADASGSKRKDVGGGKRSTNATKGWVEVLGEEGKGQNEEVKNTGIRCCIVHLYREDEETENRMRTSRNTISTPPMSSSEDRETVAASSTSAPSSQESSILCIPSVPSHITPSDFLSWVGPDTMTKVSHFRMVMTGQPNRYLVLMKFRDSRDARWWGKLWDGRRFDGGVKEETASVLSVCRVIFETPTTDINLKTSAPRLGKSATNDRGGDERSSTSSSERSFPDMTNDPFTPSLNPTGLNMSGNGNGNNSTLSEIPTCPVCLERMETDTSDTTTNPCGLLTILCQHVFHCACLQKWRGSGCPVCRHTQNKSLPLRTAQGRAPFGRNPGEAEACSVCGCDEDLWICLVCGNVGCGRYKGGHAKRHWQDSQQSSIDDYVGNENNIGGHNYALEIETQHVWDYVGDKWVHRLIMDQGDGKLENGYGSSNSPENPQNNGAADHHDMDNMEMVPREKLETIGLEYTHLLTSSLDSQRLYFEDLLSQAASATASAASTEKAAKEYAAQVQALSQELALLKTETIPQLEKERDRAVAKSEKSAEVARGLSRACGEEKEVSKGLMKRVEYLNKSMAEVAAELTRVKAENEDLKEQNRDLGFFISSSEKVKGLDGELGEEVREGFVGVPEVEGGRKGKGKGRKR